MTAASTARNARNAAARHAAAREARAARKVAVLNPPNNRNPQMQCTHSFDGENDVKLEITYKYTPGQREIGPTYSCGGQPAEGPDIEILTLTVDGRPATDAEMDQAVCCDRLWNKMREEAE